jgi:PAS domain S-box-containing protein
MIVMSWFELVQTLIQTIPFPMDIVDEKGTILFQNQVFEDMFGPDAIGKKCWELYQDNKKQCPNCPLHRSIEIGATESNISYDTLGGKIYDIHHTGMMFQGKKAMLEVFVDITNQREITDELARSEERFRQLFGNMEQGFALHEMIYDDNGDPFDYRHIMVNKAFETLTGLKGADVIGKTIREVVPHIEDYWVKSFGEVVKTGVPGQFENYVEAFAGKRFNATVYSPKKDLFAVVFYDVTKYKEDEKKLADRRKFIDSILNVCPSVIYVYDLIEKKNVYSNRGVEEMLGYTCSDIEEMGSDLLKIIMHPKDFKVYVEETFPKYKKLKNKTLKHEYRMKHKNGRYVRLVATEVIYKTDDKGKPTQIVGNIIKA